MKKMRQTVDFGSNSSRLFAFFALSLFYKCNLFACLQFIQTDITNRYSDEKDKPNFANLFSINTVDTKCEDNAKIK